MPVLEILLKAKTQIDAPHKWIKGLPFIGVACCSIVAIARACSALESDPEDYDAAQRTLASALPLKWNMSVFDFNDDPETTHADVMALFDQAIAKAEGRDQ